MKQIVYLNGYTKRIGKGIYRSEFDSATGVLTTPVPYYTKLGSPTYLAAAENGVLYAVDAENGEGGVAAIDTKQNPPALLNKLLVKGTSPAHVSVDEKRQLVFAGNYHEGRVNVYAIQADGSLKDVDVAQHDNAGIGPRPEQQDGAHVHFAALTPDQKRLAVVDLGLDEVDTYPVADDGKLGKPAALKLEAGFGPRHLAFNTAKPYAYLLAELSSQIAVLAYDEDSGKFTQGQTQKTIPADYTGHNGAAAIRITKDNKFVYTTNRGHNSLNVYAVSKDGSELTLIQQLSTEGEFPRDFNLDLTETYLLAVNQNTDNATLYSRDAKSGKLTLVQKDISAPEATNVTFLKA